MPLIGNVTNTYNYYSDRDTLVEIISKINNLNMAVNSLLKVVADLKVATETLGTTLSAEIVQIDEKFAVLLARIAELENSDAVLAAAEDLRENVLTGINAASEAIKNIIPDDIDDEDEDEDEDDEGDEDDEN